MSSDDRELSDLIRRHATRHSAPDQLRAGIRTQIAVAAANRAPAATPPTRRPRRPWLAWGWGTAMGSFALGVLCTALVLPLVQQAVFTEPLQAELVADHVRALRLGPLTEVVSSDRHTVKPWFQGRVDFAPPVFDLAADGFPLIGGRVEHVRGDTVAALAYGRNRHVIDLFVWPEGATRAPAHSVQRGFNVVHWSDGSMQYWAVSDVEREELETMVRLWQERAAAR
jgi:anti-sigma factor RsiW